MIKLIRVILLLPGGLWLFLHLCKEGSRDLLNKIRFKNSKIARGSSIDSASILFEHTAIGTDSILNNTQMKSYSYIGNNCLIQFARIGKFCSIGTNVYIGLGIHPQHFLTTSPLFYKRNNPLNIEIVDNDLFKHEYLETIIDHDVWIGNNVLILGGVAIGQGAIIAAGSVVTKHVPPYAIVAGVPAKVKKFRFDNQMIEYLLSLNIGGMDINQIKNINQDFHTNGEF